MGLAPCVMRQAVLAANNHPGADGAELSPSNWPASSSQARYPALSLWARRARLAFGPTVIEPAKKCAFDTKGAYFDGGSADDLASRRVAAIRFRVPSMRRSM